jgi:hypothetical protein
MTVLMLRIEHAGYGKMQHSNIVSRRSLPGFLKHDNGLYTLVSHLVQQQQYWAAAQVMTICLQLPTADCAALQKATGTFLRGDPKSDDEPTVYFRMLLIQTFMEGLLGIGFERSGESSKLWSSFRAACNQLHPVLEEKFGKQVWCNSRGYWRDQVLDIDRALSDRNPQLRQQALRRSQLLLPQLRIHATRHCDRKLLVVFQRQSALLVRSTPQSPITSLDGARLLPIGDSANRNASPVIKGQLASQQSVPAVQTMHRSNIVTRSGGPSRAPQT